MTTPEAYTTSEKLAGLDLHGLPCRIPEPTPLQAVCSHTEEQLVDEGDGWHNHEGEWVVELTFRHVTTMRDVPGTNNLQCFKCGYTQRY